MIANVLTVLLGTWLAFLPLLSRLILHGRSQGQEDPFPLPFPSPTRSVSLGSTEGSSPARLSVASMGEQSGG